MTASPPDEDRPGHRLDALAQRAGPFLPVALATLWLGRTTSRAVLARAGEPAVPLDDAFIHFQYARALAEGRFFAFLPGESYTSGATSLLWPAMLAPFYLLGLRDTSIVWAAWGLGWFFLALLAVETYRLAKPLTGEACAVGAAAMTLAFGGHTWFAASGMEVTPLAWCLARTARLAGTWVDRPAERSPSLRNQLIALSVFGPLMRPEGTVASALALVTLASFAPLGAAANVTADEGAPKAESAAPEASATSAVWARWGLRDRAFSLLCAIGPALPPLVNRAFTGHFSTTTTQVKWLALNPYYGGPNLWSSVRGNLDTFVKTLLDGREWSAIFLPQGSLTVAAAAFVALPLAGYRTRRYGAALAVLLMAVGMAIPTTYVSFLWNRLRYLWPFAFAWCVALACFARAVGDLVGAIRPRLASAGAVAAGLMAGMLAQRLSWSIDDVAQSASAIHRQQVWLGRWAREHLPAGARIGVNDTGAIAYFSERKTFDVVGLTTPGEAPYWVAGAGSRYEHYERLHRARPDALPTHFIVYPHWMACEPVLGRELTRATVVDQSILGGATMVAYEARYDRLHTGDLPGSPPAGRLIDEVDVADLESEVEHAYDVRASGGTEADNLVHVRDVAALGSAAAGLGDDEEHDDEDVPARGAGERAAGDAPQAPTGAGARGVVAATQVDGGRGRRTLDRFTVKLAAGGRSTLVARWLSHAGATLSVRVGGAEVEQVTVPATSWVERTVDLGARAGSGPATVEIASRDGRTFGSMHYWVYETR